MPRVDVDKVNVGAPSVALLERGYLIDQPSFARSAWSHVGRDGAPPEAQLIK